MWGQCQKWFQHTAFAPSGKHKQPQTLTQHSRTSRWDSLQHRPYTWQPSMTYWTFPMDCSQDSLSTSQGPEWNEKVAPLVPKLLKIKNSNSRVRQDVSVPQIHEAPALWSWPWLPRALLLSVPPALPSHCSSQFTRQFGWTFINKVAAGLGGTTTAPTPSEIYQIALTYSAFLFPPQTLESCFRIWQIRVSRVFGKFPGCWSSPEESGPGVLPRC